MTGAPPGSLLAHRLDPRTKLLLAFGGGVLAFVLERPVVLLALLGLVVLAAVIVKTENAPLRRGLRPVLWFALCALVGQFVVGGSKDPAMAVMALLRLMILAVLAALLLRTTSPAALTSGLAKLLTPLGYCGVPVHDFALSVSLALHFVPTLIEEAERLHRARSVRAANQGSRSLRQYGRDCLALAVPLLAGALRRGDTLATAMESRCFRGAAGRSSIRPLSFTRADLAGSGIAAACTTTLLFFEYWHG